MKIEEAYSLDYCEVIDPEKAHELYWEGIIKDKRNFTCPYPGCKAQITCSNIDKLKSAMKNIVHFRVYGKHVEGCDYIDEIVENEYTTEFSDENGQSRTTNNSDVDIFEYERPESHKLVKSKEESELDHEEIKKRIRRNRVDSNSQVIRSSTYHSLKPLVSKYISFKEKRLIERKFINIKGYNVSYSKMFIDIDNTSFDEFDKYIRIYFGLATIRKSSKNEDDFIIRFKNKINYKGSSYASSIYVSMKTIEKNYYKSMWIRDLESFSEEEFYVFIHSKPIINGNYINFSLSKMEFLELRTI